MTCFDSLPYSIIFLWMSLSCVDYIKLLYTPWNCHHPPKLIDKQLATTTSLKSALHGDSAKKTIGYSWLHLRCLICGGVYGQTFHCRVEVFPKIWWAIDHRAHMIMLFLFWQTLWPFNMADNYHRSPNLYGWHLI